MLRYTYFARLVTSRGNPTYEKVYKPDNKENLWDTEITPAYLYLTVSEVLLDFM